MSEKGSFLRFRISSGEVEGPPAKKARKDAGSLQVDLACYRCRRMKRKCCRSRPECSSCIAAGVGCKFPEKDRSDIDELRSQIELLSRYVYYHMPLSPPASSTASLSRSDQGSPWKTDGIGENAPQIINEIKLFEPRRGSSLRRFPGEIDLKQCIEAYFSNVHKSSPFLNKIRTMNEVDELLRSDGTNNCVPTKLYMLGAIGGAALNLTGQVSDEFVAKIAVPYNDIICECLEASNVESVEVLLLLALYSVYDPSGMSPWVLTGILGRQVIALGLNRRQHVGDGASSPEELQHRLFWSSFELDRVVASSYGLPVAINDENINLPLPGVTAEEYTASEKGYYAKSLQIGRNIVALRDLEGKILHRIHLSNAALVTSLSLSDHRAIIDDFRSRIDNWYAQGCLLSDPYSDTIPFHNTIPWLNVNYYNILILLYIPTQFNTNDSLTHLLNLRRSIRQYVSCSSVQLQLGKLSLNRITINRLIVTVVILLLLFRLRGSSRDFEVDDEEVTSCIHILDSFPTRWSLARRIKGLFQRFKSCLETSISISHTARNFSISIPEQQLAINEVSRNIEDDLMKDALALISESFGPSSAYNKLIDMADDIKIDEYRNMYCNEPDPSRRHSRKLSMSKFVISSGTSPPEMGFSPEY